MIQLDEFQRAVGLSYVNTSGEESRDRHREFIVAMEDHISKVEGSLQESSLSQGKKTLPWVRLDEGESKELALFLSGTSAFLGKDDTKQQGSADDSIRWGAKEARSLKSHGHRRAASDIGAWNIVVAESQPNPSSGQPLRIPRRVPSVSGLLGSIEFAPKIKLPKNGGKKWKAKDINQESDIIPLHSSQLTKVRFSVHVKSANQSIEMYSIFNRTSIIFVILLQDIHSCYEKSKTCLGGCDECYDKQLYGWYGAIQRQLQRSQYQMQYSRPVQVVIWIVVVLLCLIGKQVNCQIYFRFPCTTQYPAYICVHLCCSSYCDIDNS